MSKPKPDVFDLLLAIAARKTDEEVREDLAQVIEIVRQESLRRRQIRVAVELISQELQREGLPRETRRALTAARRAIEAARQPLPRELSQAFEELGASA